MTTIKKKYKRPTLTLFGTVRNLTGGSGSVGRDGAIANSRNTPGGR